MQEGKAEFGIGTDAVQTVFGDVGDLVDGVRAQVRQFFRLEAAPNLLDGIDVRCVARQRLD